MAKFRKKALVDAEQFVGPTHVPEGEPRPVVPNGVVWMPGLKDGKPEAVAALMTLEGPHFLWERDWIVTNPAGEKYNVSDEVFRSTYEAVEESAPPKPIRCDGLLPHGASTSSLTLKP
jgi:hypothetical protein